MGKRRMAGLEAWGRGMAGAKQWEKERWLITLENKSQTNQKQIKKYIISERSEEMTDFLIFLRFVFKSYRVSLFSIA